MLVRLNGVLLSRVWFFVACRIIQIETDTSEIETDRNRLACRIIQIETDTRSKLREKIPLKKLCKKHLAIA